ncbi:adenosylmethionine--8-amino-7-oxononanoate transaminase [Xylella fastidiosa]|nr:adenosylmethionine--8-amino-7-oxononanoate transaminase [Xylella fastidiosa]ALQ93923.1 adenosylmethionine-8-amino-7-oxononanoate aminotransferase [Xylella fastidiosa]ALQ96170.1 adenosylmethionine--8-amino-7-oxononanoate transaminase [Xylella fastidiosa]ALR01019.1 adenosylmethionine-8-amino-7-oxononanoate aminotransferase [Xylella fastidiosa]ALR08020.2 adenosylmethionine--8-amino-7-oxononanoate transaminase [Xylella fastidiosa]KXB14942.1 adenosylmethionine-8-amino-7-oxononanoate aminotransfe
MHHNVHQSEILADPCDLQRAERWLQRDLRVLWHPCTQMREHPDTLPLVPIVRGEGAWLVGHDGRRYLDAVSSWWTNLFGHADPRISAAIAAQARTLEQVMLAGFSHEPAVRLAEALLRLAPRQDGREPLSKVFYADNGSAGVEVALKMAFHYFRNRGEEQRTRFIALHNGYHGETIGALAVGDIPLYRRVYAPLLTEVLFAPSPDAYLAEPGQSAAEYALQAAEALEVLFKRYSGQICALILEPLLQCAGGMRMHHPVYLHRVRELCDAHGALLICDEIATGFGRTGTLFACEQACPVILTDTDDKQLGIMPDLLCLSKGLTGGFLPLAAVLTTQQLYEEFLDDSRERAFLHSHSYTGNPLACIAALTTLDIFENDCIIERNQVTAARMTQLAASLSGHPHVADVRQAGMVVAFELTRDGNKRTPFPLQARLGLHVYRAALARGVILRPLGDVVYWMPPYCVDEEQLHLLAETTRVAIDEAIACV